MLGLFLGGFDCFSIVADLVVQLHLAARIERQPPANQPILQKIGSGLDDS
jgi:hypothetical protein